MGSHVSGLLQRADAPFDYACVTRGLPTWWRTRQSAST